LYLNGQPVGKIDVQGWDGAWGFGSFQPDPAFAQFAPLYDEWARLMHSPKIAEQLTEDVADALRKVENALYAIEARIYIEDIRAWRKADILTIDGALIEWKEGWCQCNRASTAAGPQGAKR
jgi:hypothetical protein